MEERLRGAAVSPEALAAAAEAIGDDLEPVGDAHASAGYRRQMARVVARRAVTRRDREGDDLMSEAGTVHTVTITINGERYERTVLARQLLVHFLRDTLGLRGTHIGCDTGNCGACTVIWDGKLIKSCMMLAAQADGAEIETVEGIAADGELTRSSAPSTSTTRSSAATAPRAC